MEIITIIGLLLFLVYREYQAAKERKDLIKAIMSKNLTEYVSNDKIKTEQTEVKPPDLIPVEQADDKEFQKMIKQQLGQPTVVETVKRKVNKLFNKNAK